MPALDLSLLGHPKITLSNKLLDTLPGKARALLFYLAVTRQAHSRQALAGLLWSDLPETRALNNLRVVLVDFRRHNLEEPYLVTHRHTLAFNRESDYQVDVARFESLLQQPQPPIVQLSEAVALYQGNFLEDFWVKEAPLFEDWVQAQQERLRKMALDALYRLYTYHTQQRHYELATRYARRVLELEPWLEEAHRQLMLLYALTGQRAAALAQYEQCRRILREELGVDPSKTTVDVYKQIVNGEIDQDVDALTAVFAEKIIIIPPPFQAPPLVNHFVGRSVELDLLRRHLTQSPGPLLCALVGMGGAGKTTLAIHAAHALHTRFPDGILWANAANSEPFAILESWSQAYGYDFSRVADLESRAAAFRGVLTDKKVLVVLDNVVSVSRIRPLLPNGVGCAVLFTTRDQDLARALNAQVLLVGEMLPEDGRNLLITILGHERVMAELEAADTICTLLSNLPLAVEITAQRLLSHPRRRLTDMATRLENVKNRLSELTISDQEVRASFEVSWVSLDWDEKKILALLGVFEGRPFTAQAIAHIANLDHYTAEDRLFALVALSLVRESGQTYYRQHPLLADFAREKLGEGTEEYGRFAAYYLTFAQQYQRDYDVLRPEWGNLMVGIQLAREQKNWSLVMAYADTLTVPWLRRGRYAEARQGYQWALLAAQTIEDHTAQANYLRQWGLACLEQRDFGEAVEKLAQSLQLCQSLNDSIGIAQNQCDLARIAIEQTSYDLARKHLFASRSLRETLRDIPGIAETLHMEARMCYFQGKHKETIQLGKQALEVLAMTTYEDKTIRTLSLLASASIMEKDLETAESYAQRALQLTEKFQDKGDQAVILTVLSDIACQQNRLDAAQTYGEKSLELLKTVGDLGTQAMVLYQLGRIYQAREQYEAALQSSLESLKLSKLSQFRLQMGWVLTQIAECHEKLGQIAQAKEKWQEAWDLAQSLQHAALIKKVEGRSRNKIVTHPSG